MNREMAHRALVELPDGTFITEREVTPLSQRIVHFGEFLGWALLTFAVLYFGLHIVVSFL